MSIRNLHHNLPAHVLDSAFVAELDQHIDWLIARHPGLRPESLGHHLIANDPFWIRFLSDTSEKQVQQLNDILARDFTTAKCGSGNATLQMQMDLLTHILLSLFFLLLMIPA